MEMLLYVIIYSYFLSSSFTTASSCPVPSGTTVTFPDVSESVVPVATSLKTTYNAQGLGGFFNLANSFMNTVQSKPFYETFEVDDFKNIDQQAVRDKIIKYETPIGITAAVGFLFAIFMPIFGLCFCCCRCCGKCGGEMVQKEEDAVNHTKCCICSFILMVLVIFLLCGVMFMLVCNSRLKTAVKDVPSSYTASLDLGIAYANTTVQELQLLSEDQLTCAINLVTMDINDDGIKANLGTPIRDQLFPVIGIALDAVINATLKVKTMSTKLEQIQNSTNDLKTAGSSLETQLTDIRQRLIDILQNCTSVPRCNAIDTDSLKLIANFSMLPNISAELSNLQNILQQNFSGAAAEGKNVFDNLPTTISDRSVSMRNDIRKTILDAQQKMRYQVTNLTDDINSELINKKTDYTKYEDDMSKYINDYDKYRDYAFIGLSCLAGIILLCLGLGLTCGVCGYKRKAEPSNRSTLSHCGGNCLMAGVGFIFIFSFFLMLFTTISFMVGIHMHIVCRDVKDGTVIDKYADGKIKFEGEVIKVADVLSNCRDNQPIYAAIDGKRFLDVDEKINLTKLTDGIDKELEKLNVSVSDQSILNDKTRQALTNLSESAVDKIDFASFLDELVKDLVSVDLAALSANLTSISNDLRATPNPDATALAGKLDGIISELGVIDSTSIPSITADMNSLKTQVDEMDTLADGLKNTSLDILVKLEAADDYLQSSASGVITQQVKIFANRIMGWIEQFANHIKTQITTKMARCKPIATLYDSVIDVTVCKSFVDNFNGYWLALGWCMFFFIPLIIFSVKLAKYFRRMKCLDGFGGLSGVRSYPSYDHGHDKIPLQQAPPRRIMVADGKKTIIYEEHKN